MEETSHYTLLDTHADMVILMVEKITVTLTEMKNLNLMKNTMDTLTKLIHTIMDTPTLTISLYQI
jgi:hypothetical protein